MAYGKNAPFGLRPYASKVGGTWPAPLNTYKIATSLNGQTTYNGSLFTGDPVFWASGNANNSLLGTIGNLGDVAAGTYPVGVFQGCEYYDVNNTLQKKACWIAGTRVRAGSSIKAFIIDDPFAVYDIQVSTSTNSYLDTIVEQSWFGDNAKISVAVGGNTINNPGAGNPQTGVSAYYLDGESLGTDPQAFLKILDFTPNPQNLAAIVSDQYGANTTTYLNVLVMFNMHYLKGGTVGTGGGAFSLGGGK